MVFIQIIVDRKRNTLEKRFYVKNGSHEPHFENII